MLDGNNLILFILFTDIYILLYMYHDSLLCCYCYHYRIIPVNLGNMYINNIKQITLGLGKLVEETASVFWVDLGFRLRSRKRVPLQGSRGVTGTPSCSCYTCYTCTCSCLHVPVVGPGSAPGVWAVVPGMHRTHLKHGQCLQPISFNN